MQYEILKVGEKVKRLIRKGKQVYSVNLVKKIDKQPGSLVKIMYGNEFLAWGSINPRNQYNYLRIISYKEDFNIEDELKEKIKKAKRYREKIGYKNHYRLIYSESDFLSGLIIDRYNDIFVIQNVNPFFDKNINLIVNSLKDVFGNNITIYEKSIGKGREKEGLLPIERFLYGEKYRTIIEEVNRRFLVDILIGQKTGWFLDQRENRKILSKINGDKVLDVFSYTGSFGIIINSSERYFVEKDKKVINILKENLRINNIENYKIFNENAYYVLKKLNEERKKFDIVILDPPDLLAEGYQKGIKNFTLINSIAIDLIDEGFLITFSCSQDLKEDKMFSILRTLLRRKGKRFEIAKKLHQAMDHKVIFPHKELEYLKGFIIEIPP